MVMGTLLVLLIPGVFPLCLIGLVVVIFAVAASFFLVSEERRAGCLLLSITVLVVLFLFPAGAIWASAS